VDGPDIAYAVRCLPLLDQLELTVELLADGHKCEAELPPNVIPFRPCRSSLRRGRTGHLTSAADRPALKGQKTRALALLTPRLHARAEYLNGSANLVE
jgi:hypothetical protein